MKLDGPKHIVKVTVAFWSVIYDSEEREPPVSDVRVLQGLRNQVLFLQVRGPSNYRAPPQQDATPPPAVAAKKRPCAPKTRRHRRKGLLRTVRGHAKRDEQDDEGRNDRRRRAKRPQHLRKDALVCTACGVTRASLVRARAARALSEAAE